LHMQCLFVQCSSSSVWSFPQATRATAVDGGSAYDAQSTGLLRQATGLLLKSLPQPSCPSRPLQRSVSVRFCNRTRRCHMSQSSAAPAPHVQLRRAAAAVSCCCSSCLSDGRRVLAPARNRHNRTGHGHTIRSGAITSSHVTRANTNNYRSRTCCWCCRCRVDRPCCSPRPTAPPAR
jgi:hypothetical protein